MLGMIAIIWRYAMAQVGVAFPVAAGLFGVIVGAQFAWGVGSALRKQVDPEETSEKLCHLAGGAYVSTPEKIMCVPLAGGKS